MKDFQKRAVADQQNTDKLNSEMIGKDSRANDQKEKGSKYQGFDADMFRRYSFDDNGGGYAGL